MEINTCGCQKNMLKAPISVIVLTYNEEKNIEECLKSVYEWVDEIFAVDSGSTDGTLEIVRRYTDKIFQHSFEDYGKQRNWAQKTLPITNEWILHLDADERILPELVNEIKEVFKNVLDDVNGFLIKKRMIFMGRWIKHGGHYPVYHLRLFRKEKGFCESRKYDQHFICTGKVTRLKHDILEENNIDLTEWTNRHNQWSSSEAEEHLMESIKINQVNEKIWGTPIERRRWLKNKIFRNSPLFIRSFLYFFYRYFFRLGFLDGKEGLIFHFLQGFWFRFLVDAKLYEMKFKKSLNSKLEHINHEQSKSEQE